MDVTKYHIVLTTSIAVRATILLRSGSDLIDIIKHTICGLSWRGDYREGHRCLTIVHLLVLIPSQNFLDFPILSGVSQEQKVH